MDEITLSAENDSILCIELHGTSYEANYMNINVVEIKKTHDEWLMSVGNLMVHDNGSLKVKIQIRTDYPDMLCEVTHLTLSTIENGVEDPERPHIELIGGKDFDRIFFKISQKALQVYKDIKKEADQIKHKRKQKFFEPIGDVQCEQAHDFSIFVFLSNCFLPAGTFFLEKCQAIPHDNLGVSDIVESVKSLIDKTNLNLKLPDSNSVRKRLERFKPATVLYFPSIMALSSDAAFEFISERLHNIINLLSYRRMAKVDVFAYLFYEKSANKAGLSIPEEVYSGNILPDFASESTYLLNLEPKVARNTFIQFILNLYRYALAEKRPNFIYFSLWNILESIARYKGFDIEKNPNGSIKLNMSGIPLKAGAVKMVSELISKNYAKNGISPNFTSDRKTYSVIDMTIMWCQHRNCTAHRGGCNPNNTSQCDIRNPNVVKCRDYTISASNLQLDLYLRTIKRIAREMIDDLLYH